MSGGRDAHAYLVCPECGRTILVKYDEPEPELAAVCDDGHEPASMEGLVTDGEPRPCCADTGPDGYACTREEGHDGPHAALTVGAEWGRGDSNTTDTNK